MRGINRQSIFEDVEDCEKFIRTLQKYKEVCGYELYAHCLMGNHLHLLLMEGKDSFEKLDRLIKEFCENKNISQKDTFQVALIDFLNKNVYRSEAKAVLNV